MFDKQYRFTGSHAEKVSALTSVFDDVAKAKLFERNLDVYMNAPLIGFLFKRKGVKNSDGDIADQNIFPEQLINNSEQLKYIFRLILILDKAVGGKSFSDAQDSTSCLTALLHFKDTPSADELKKSGLWQEV